MKWLEEIQYKDVINLNFGDRVVHVFNVWRAQYVHNFGEVIAMDRDVDWVWLFWFKTDKEDFWYIPSTQDGLYIDKRKRYRRLLDGLFGI